MIDGSRPLAKDVQSPIGARYEVVGELGRGGMAVVLEVFDTVVRERLALKQLLPADRPEESELLFRQEYHGLSHLAHPRIVRVFDYGAAEGRLFYTMELLAGGDLRELAPLPYGRVCALLSDVCSALSLLHSRRLVHRDLTPRNIRCTADGAAKLIDFGAMMPFGPCWRAVGTPPYCAPEMLDGDELDGRADLFALGATAYYALTRRHAYPVTDFGLLRDAWRVAPRPLSELVPDVPAELSELIDALLSIDRGQRPATAAEVMERLAAIAGLDGAEQLVVPQSYLITPALVGRTKLLSGVRRVVRKGLAGGGSALMISAPPGMGRSRFLSACVLEAKLLGATVIRAQADGEGGAYWGARQLFSHLQEQHPSALQGVDPEVAAVVRWLVAEPDTSVRIRALPGAEAPEPRTYSRPQVQRALSQVLYHVAQQRGLVLAVDDLHRLDEPSLALCALWAHAAKNQALVVIGTCVEGGGGVAEAALHLLQTESQPLRLGSLAKADCDELLGSIFGNMASLPEVAQHLYRVSSGAPGPLMQLAQHLLDQRVVVYEAGSWTLAGEFVPGSLPSTVAEAIAHTVKELSPRGLALAQSIALIRHDAVKLDELLLLGAAADTQEQTLTALDELVRVKVLRVDGHNYTLHHDGFIGPVLETLQEPERRALHLRLAELFHQRGLSLREVEHLYCAGERDAAVELLVEFSQSQLLWISAERVAELMRQLPVGWTERVTELLAYCETAGRSQRDKTVLRSTLVSTHVLLGGQFPERAARSLLSQLRDDSGLDLYAALDPQMPEGERLQIALNRAQERYDAASEHERVADPAAAIPWLCRVILQLIGLKGAAFDVPFIESIPSLAPITALSPAVAVVEWNVQATRHVSAGNIEAAVALFERILARLQEPDGAGLDSAHNRYVRLAILQALMQVRVSRGTLPEGGFDALRDDPLFEVSGCRLQRQFALRVADFAAAERFREREELLVVQNQASQLLPVSHLVPDCEMAAFAGDLATLKQLLTKVEVAAGRHVTWLAPHLWAKGLYETLRRDYADALIWFEQALRVAPAGRHMVFPMIVASRVQCLVNLGRNEDAIEAAEAYFQLPQAQALRGVGHRVVLSGALAYLAAGQLSEAQRLADDGFVLLRQLQAGGVVLGHAHEVLAKVACRAKDEAGFRVHAARCAELYRAGKNAMLTARYGQLMAFAERQQVAVDQDLAGSAAYCDFGQTLRPALSSIADPLRRAQTGLHEIVQSAVAVGGFLYLVQARGTELVAQVGGYPPPDDLDRRARDYVSYALSSFQEEQTCTTRTARFRQLAWVAGDGGRYFPTLLAHQGETGLEIAAVAALRSADGSPVAPTSAVAQAVSRALVRVEEATAVLRGKA